MKNGIDVDVKSRSMKTPLMIAVRRNMLRTALQLLTLGANVDLQDEDGYSPLHFCAKVGASKMAKLLLLAGATKRVFDKEEKVTVCVCLYSWHRLILTSARVSVRHSCCYLMFGGGSILSAPVASHRLRR